MLDHVLLPFRKDGRAGKVRSGIAISSVLKTRCCITPEREGLPEAEADLPEQQGCSYRRQ